MTIRNGKSRRGIVSGSRCGSIFFQAITHVFRVITDFSTAVAVAVGLEQCVLECEISQREELVASLIFTLSVRNGKGGLQSATGSSVGEHFGPGHNSGVLR